MDRDEVLSIIDEARDNKEDPRLVRADLQGMDLQDANLRNINLQGANLKGSNLRNAMLEFSDLSGANLTGADLTYANLAGADLQRTNLSDANMERASLWRATLLEADLTGANLRNIDLKNASLNHATWYGLRIDGLPPEQFTLIPTPHGWDLRLDDWNWFNTPDQLSEFITNPDKWPILMKDNLEYCRPYMETALALCDIHMNNHADYIEKLKEKWVA